MYVCLSRMFYLHIYLFVRPPSTTNGGCWSSVQHYPWYKHNIKQKTLINPIFYSISHTSRINIIISLSHLLSYLFLHYTGLVVRQKLLLQNCCSCLRQNTFQIGAFPQGLNNPNSPDNPYNIYIYMIIFSL